jgi:hypothetical protein
MSVKNLDLDTLRTLMVANDLGGLRSGRGPAWPHALRHQPQMNRLHEDVGARSNGQSPRRLRNAGGTTGIDLSRMSEGRDF